MNPEEKDCEEPAGDEDKDKDENEDKEKGQGRGKERKREERRRNERYLGDQGRAREARGSEATRRSVRPGPPPSCA